MKCAIATGVATVTFADCSPLSGGDATFARELVECIRDASDEDEVKAIVLRASGENFCPMLSQEDAAVAARMNRGLQSEWRDVFASARGIYQSLCFGRKVIIAEVRGDCGAAGTLLTMCAGLAIADENARFECPFGSLPEANFVLAALTMRLNRAKAWVLRGHSLDARTAAAVGLVNRVASAGDLQAQVEGMAMRIAKMPLDGIAISKIILESCLDTQGVGREFDAVPFYGMAFQQEANAS
jgi:enoyl-CoA hydratase